MVDGTFVIFSKIKDKFGKKQYLSIATTTNVTKFSFSHPLSIYIE